MRSRSRTLLPVVALAAALAAGLGSACGGDEPSSAAVAGEDEQRARASGSQEAKAAPAAPRRNERPLPAFSGWTLGGERLAISSLIGKRLLIFFFDPDTADASTLMRAVDRIAGLRVEHNFEIVGIATGSTRESVRRFVQERGLAFPVLDDSDRGIARRLGLHTMPLMLAIDPEGYVVNGIAHFPTDEPDPVQLIEDQIRETLRLPRVAAVAEPELGVRPQAPPFEAELLDSEKAFSLAEHRGRPVVLIFFLHTCPHCHAALRALQESLDAIPEASRPALLGVEVSGLTGEVRSRLRAEGLDFFPVGFDRDGGIRRAYGVLGSVPDIVLIDAEGRIAARVRGWREREDPPLMRMRLARLAGAPVPMLLRAKGYSGNEVCGVCHVREYQTWEFTRHARAFDTLVEHAAETDPECVGCHVVGYGESGGFVSTSETGDLEDVGCETCHGRGGPHLSPGFVRDGDYAPTCASCHDSKHSLGFEYATFVPRISHAANAHLLELPLEERRARLAELGKPREDLLPTLGDYVGSEACRSCHPAEYATWEAQPHAHAARTLAAEGDDGRGECLTCHTTGFGKPGGFPADASAGAQPDLARVGCESCHGPGSVHVAEGGPKPGSILSLGDKCDSCVILQICGSCHDDANDPGFEFEVIEKIEAQRHGTIEAGTGRPLEGGAGAGARAPESPAAVASEVADAFRQLAAGGRAG